MAGSILVVIIAWLARNDAVRLWYGRVLPILLAIGLMLGDSILLNPSGWGVSKEGPVIVGIAYVAVWCIPAGLLGPFSGHAAVRWILGIMAITGLPAIGVAILMLLFTSPNTDLWNGLQVLTVITGIAWAAWIAISRTGWLRDSGDPPWDLQWAMGTWLGRRYWRLGGIDGKSGLSDGLARPYGRKRMAPANRPIIWASDLASGSLPMVCVRTGRVADATLKFSFATVTDDTADDDLIVRALAARRASGPLPLIRSQRQLLRVVRRYEWLSVLGGPLLFGVGMLGGIAVPWSPVMGLIFIVVGAALLLSFLPWIVVKRFILPQGRVFESPGASQYLIELRKVHPNFAAAVRDMDAARAVTETFQASSL